MEENLEMIVDKFEFKCPHCKSKSIEFKPLGISWKPTTVQDKLKIETNKCIDEKTKRASTQMMEYFNKIPYLKDALIKCDKNNILGVCQSCNMSFGIHGDLDRNEFRSWLNKWAKETNNEPPAMILRE